MLKLDIEWESGESIKGAELRATWARLGVDVSGQVVTEVFDDIARTRRDAIFVPAYPLAEWFAFHWFPLLHEVPGSCPSIEYARRHNTLFAGDGYAWPDLLIQPEGTLVRLLWRSHRDRYANTHYLSGGECVVPRGDLEDALGNFVYAVLQRLDAEGVADTPLHREWARIGTLESGERDFSVLAGEMGLDAADLPPGIADRIVRAYEGLPESFVEEFFSCATPAILDAQYKWVRGFVKEAGAAPHLDADARQLRAYVQKSLRPKRSTQEPWREGYRIAAKLRQYLSLNGQPVPSDKLLEHLGVEAWKTKPAADIQVDALAWTGEDGQTLAIAVSSAHEPNSRFAFARAYYEFLTAEASGGLATKAVNSLQKANRAFAAELLAPASAIKKRLPRNRSVYQSDLEVIASEFKVSPYVIGHQIENQIGAELLPA